MKIKKGFLIWLKLLFGSILVGISASLCYSPLVYLVGDRAYKNRNQDALEGLAAQIGFGIFLLIVGSTLLRKSLKEYFAHGDK
jgi:hypothetical protein